MDSKATMVLLYQKIASVSSTCKSALHAILALNRRTHTVHRNV